MVNRMPVQIGVILLLVMLYYSLIVVILDLQKELNKERKRECIELTVRKTPKLDVNKII